MGIPEVVMNNDMEVSIQNKAYELRIFSDLRGIRPLPLVCWDWQWAAQALQLIRNRLSRMLPM